MILKNVRELCDAIGTEAIIKAHDAEIEKLKQQRIAEKTMPGIEILKDRMRKMGCTQTQLESKTFTNTIIALAALNDESAMDIGRACDELMRQARADRAEAERIKRDAQRVSESQRKKDTETDKAIQCLYGIVSDMQELMNEMFEPETPALRDLMRTAKYYRENIKINTCYDNTAYINRLGAILANITLDEGVEKQEGAKAKKVYYNNATITQRIEDVKKKLDETRMRIY